MPMCANCGMSLFDGQFACPACQDRRLRAEMQKQVEDRRRSVEKNAVKRPERLSPSSNTSTESVSVSKEVLTADEWSKSFAGRLSLSITTAICYWVGLQFSPPSLNNAISEPQYIVVGAGVFGFIFSALIRRVILIGLSTIAVFILGVLLYTYLSAGH